MFHCDRTTRFLNATLRVRCWLQHFPVPRNCAPARVGGRLQVNQMLSVDNEPRVSTSSKKNINQFLGRTAMARVELFTVVVALLSSGPMASAYGAPGDTELIS